MFRELLEGVYNFAELVWLDLRWVYLSALRRYYVKDVILDSITAEYMQVMPRGMMIRFSDYRGHIVWKYEIYGGKIRLFKGWKNSLENNLNDAPLERFILSIHDKYAYDEIDKILE